MTLESALIELVPSIETVERIESVGGGCISNACCVQARTASGDSTRLFAKHNEASFLSNFEAEWRGLNLLLESTAVGVPEPLAVGIADNRAWLVSEWIEQSNQSGDFFESLGRDLARLHQVTLGDAIGLNHDNFLGSARQINTPCADWCEFVAEHRIGFQIHWAVDQQLADDRLIRDCQTIINRVPELLAGREETTSLLHGDLWSGNYLAGPGGRPVIIDPAVYHGCREAEFGMLKLFGSCSAAFYEAYDDAFPLPAGWQGRVNLYVLYHLLNHLNLFGGGYLEGCKSKAGEVLKAS